LQLKYVIHNEVLLITRASKAESDEYMPTRAYPIEDLIVADDDGTVDVQPLKDLLTNTIATKTWVDNGGTGTLSDIVVGKRVLLVISQTQDVHDDIENAFAMLRKAGAVKSASQDNIADERSEGKQHPPIRPRRIPTNPGVIPQGFGMGGLGGMGMGGMGASGAIGRTPNVTGVVPAQAQAPSGSEADLLEGLKSSYSADQKAHVMRLKQRQEAGQGGMGGGMGGGFF
jgi:hypothetical protein